MNRALMSHNEIDSVNADLIDGASHHNISGLINIEVKEEHPYESIADQRESNKSRYSDDFNQNQDSILNIDSNLLGPKNASQRN